MESRKETLIILGHGSSKHPDSSASVRKHAEWLQKHTDYFEVRVAFLKEEPFIENCLEAIQTDRVLIVPDFLAEGYFTRQVIPGILKSSVGYERAIYCPPVGSHPMMSGLLQQAASLILGEWDSAQTSLFVVGHGSGKNPCSKQTLLHHLEEIRNQDVWGQVQDLWLEEPPRIENWRSLVEQQQVVVVPYLLNDGQHGGWDIPKDLGIEKGEKVHGTTHQLDGCLVRITPALGTSGRFADAIDSIASVWAGLK